MPRYEHLPLRRIQGALERRKHGFGRLTPRDAPVHGQAIQREIETVVAARKRKPKIANIDPALILRVRVAGHIPEDLWENLDLSVLASDADKTLILFASDSELQEFRRRVAAYQQIPPIGQTGPSYAQLVSQIESIDEVNPSDGIGPVLKAEGFNDVADFAGVATDAYDIELWQPTVDDAPIFTARVTRQVEDLGGEFINEYRGISATLVRVRCDGNAMRALLELPEIAIIDRCPIPDLPELEDSAYIGNNVAPGAAPDPEAPVIGIIDSGLTAAHPLLQQGVAGVFGVPPDMGDHDERGHGTPVSGVAVFGDLRERLDTGNFDMPFRLASAKVVDQHGRFHNLELPHQQIDAAIRRLHDEHGCKVINMSLCDATRVVSDKAGAWAAVLDGLARELDLVIVVSAGNVNGGVLYEAHGDGIVANYPAYLFNPENRILEPASAVNVLTVGAIAHSNGMSVEDGDLVGVRPITNMDEPSPFTRVGPGVSKTIKPDLIDYGGTAVLDGPMQRLATGKQRAAAGVISTNQGYLTRYFSSHSGTSFSSPLVAYKAAVIRQSFPDTSANLTRAFLALSAEIPEAATQLLDGVAEDAVLRACGYGVADLNRALNSDDNRVVLFAEDTLETDQFAVYEVPIPEPFQTTKGAREIKVALAFDPLVRHTRLDYAGTNMSFLLVRGLNAQAVFDACRKWERDEGDATKFGDAAKCKLKPGQNIRKHSTLQCASFRAQRDISRYGDSYYLVVRNEGGWAENVEAEQRFSIAVEVRHEADIAIYQRIEARVRLRA